MPKTKHLSIEQLKEFLDEGKNLEITPTGEVLIKQPLKGKEKILTFRKKNMGDSY